MRPARSMALAVRKPPFASHPHTRRRRSYAEHCARVDPIERIVMLKVAFITNFIPPYRRTFYEKLCRANGQLEWLIVCGNTGEHGRAATTDEIGVPQRQVFNAQYRLGPFTIRWQRGALAAVRDYAPDVLIVLGISGTLSNWAVLAWARWHKVPVIMWTCGWEPQVPDSMAFRLKKVVAGLYFRAADCLLVYGSKGGRYMTDVFGVAASRVEICYNGIETDGLLAREADTLDHARELRGQRGGRHRGRSRDRWRDGPPLQGRDSVSLGQAIRACLELAPVERRRWGGEARRLIVERSNVNAMVATFIATIARLTGTAASP